MSANHTEPPSKGKRKKKNSHIRWIVTVFFVAVVISSTISFFSSTVLEGAGLVEAFLVLLLIVALGIVFDIIGVAVMSAEDKPFQSVLIAQRNRYQDIYDRTLQLSDQELKGKKTLQKLSSTMMINFQTIKDKTPSHLAGMMIQGNTMGVIDMTKSLRENQGADSSVLGLAQDLLSMQKSNIDEMKPYL